MEDFGAALALVSRNVGAIEAVLPTLPHVEAEVRAQRGAWSVRPRIVVGEAEKLAAFRGARAALAKSGTGTLELALAGVPMVGAYKVARLEEHWLKYFVKLSVSTILLPNLILGERAIPELLQRDCTPAALAGALAPLMGDGPERRAQLAALARLDQVMRLRRWTKLRARTLPPRCSRRSQARKRGPKNASAIAHRLVFPPRLAGVELARAADLLRGIDDHFLPLRDPADRARDREQDREHRRSGSPSPSA